MVPPASHRIPRVPRYSGSQLAYSQFRVRGSHSLWPVFPNRSTIETFAFCCSTTPRNRSLLVWALPISLAATLRIDFSFSSSGYLDVSVHRVPSSRTMCSSVGNGALLPLGFPIQSSADQGLLATPRSFSQLATTFFGLWCQGIHPALFSA